MEGVPSSRKPSSSKAHLTARCANGLKISSAGRKPKPPARHRSCGTVTTVRFRRPPLEPCRHTWRTPGTHVTVPQLRCRAGSVKQRTRLDRFAAFPRRERLALSEQAWSNPAEAPGCSICRGLECSGYRAPACQGPQIAKVTPGVCTLTNSVCPSGLKHAPANSFAPSGCPSSSA